MKNKIGFDLAQTVVPLAGCGWYARTLLDSMARIAPEQSFLAYQHFGSWINDPEKLSALPDRPNIHNPLGKSRQLADAAWRSAACERTAPGNPAIVHSTSFQAPIFNRVKLVLTIFDLSFWAVPQFTTDDIRLNCQAGVLDGLTRADGLIFISNHSVAEFDRYFPSFRDRESIPVAVTPLASRWPTEKNYSATPGNYWLCVGTMEPRKNFQTLLTAYEKYANGTPAAKPLWFAGGAGWKNENLRTSLERLESRGLVRVLGYVSESEMKDLYRNAYALVFPSWYEGFGLPVLEAMSQGCPVICSDCTSLPEIAGNAAHYIDPNRADSVSEALLQLHGDAQYRTELIRRGLVQSACFSWDNTAKLTLQFYEQVLAAPKRHDSVGRRNLYEQR